jgi:hypothetical protein
MRDEPDADAMPAANPRGQVRLFTMTFAVRPRDNRSAAEAKINVLRIAERPAAGPWPKREDGEGGCRGGLLRRRLDEARSRRLRLGGAVCPGGGRGGGSRDLINRDRPRGQEVDHDADAVRSVTSAIQPTSNTPGGGAKQFSGAARREAKRVERRAELGHGRGARASLPEGFSEAGRCFLPSRIIQLDEIHCHDQDASGLRCCARPSASTPRGIPLRPQPGRLSLRAWP